MTGASLLVARLRLVARCLTSRNKKVQVAPGNTSVVPRRSLSPPAFAARAQSGLKFLVETGQCQSRTWWRGHANTVELSAGLCV